MEDTKVLEEIEDAILEENKEEVKADLKENNGYPAYLDENKVVLPLSEYLALYEANNELDKLVYLFLKASELNYDKDGLQIDRYSCKHIANEVKRLAPVQYVERFNKLLEEDS